MILLLIPVAAAEPTAGPPGNPRPMDPSAGRGDDHLQPDRGVIAITAGRAASSTALLGFGLDSVVEVASARRTRPRQHFRSSIKPMDLIGNWEGAA
jgi:hypothetical protein